MHFRIPMLSWFLLLVIGGSPGLGAPAPDVRSDIREAKAALRAVENTSDPAIKAAKLAEARTLIDRIKAAEPANPELRTLESKYRYLAPPAQGAAAPATPPPADNAKTQEVLADWNAIVAMHADLRQKTGGFFPNPTNVAYAPEQTGQVIALAADVMKNDRPKILAFLKTFAERYGEPGDAMDRKIIALTPKDPKKGMYDEANKRPDDLPSQCYNGLVDRLTWVAENPAKEARNILRTAMQDMGTVESVMDTRRDGQFAAIESELRRALQFNPQDQEVQKALTTVAATRKRSAADAKKALEAARFPAHAASFAGPGKVTDLVAAVRTYYTDAYPKEKLLAVSVAGAWIVTKTNILGQPIQWGLPVHCAAQQNEPDVCRVFRMTVLTGIGAGVAKAPPFTDHWTGDSFRMLIANLK